MLKEVLDTADLQPSKLLEEKLRAQLKFRSKYAKLLAQQPFMYDDSLGEIRNLSEIGVHVHWLLRTDHQKYFDRLVRE